MTKTYLVTGGTGFIGSALVKRLVKEGYTVRVLDNNARGSDARLDDVKDRIEFVQADIRNPYAVSDACKGVNAVIHLAYINGTEYFYKKPELVLEVGVKGMMNVLDACKEHGIKELILASSSEVYQQPPEIPTKEDAPLIVPDPLNPRYSYGGGKIISELLLINYGRTHFDRAIIFRPHNVYGPDMGWEHVLPQFALRVEELKEKSPQNPIEFPIQGNGKETRAFVFIEDFIEGVMKVIEQGKHLEIYHIGTMEEVSIADVATMVGKALGVELTIKPGEITQGSTRRRCPDTSKLQELGYKPQVPLAQGIKITTEWYKENKDKKRGLQE